MYCCLPHPRSDQFRYEDTIRELVVHHNCLFPRVSSDVLYLSSISRLLNQQADPGISRLSPSLSFSKHVNCERGHDVAELFMNTKTANATLEDSQPFAAFGFMNPEFGMP